MSTFYRHLIQRCNVLELGVGVIHDKRDIDMVVDYNVFLNEDYLACVSTRQSILASLCNHSVGNRIHARPNLKHAMAGS